MPVYVWVSVAVFVGLTVPASIAAFAAVIQLFRGLRASGPKLELGFERLAVGTEELAARTERATAGFARAEASANALAASRAQLDTLLWALADVRRVLRVVLAVVSPRK